MKVAVEAAKVSLDMGLLPVGVVIASEGEILAISGKLGDRRAPRLDHAELHALDSVLLRFSSCRGMTLYSTLEPCFMCMGAILTSKISRLIFALNDPYGGASRIPKDVLPKRHQIDFPQIVSPFNAELATPLFRSFLSETEDAFWKTQSDFLNQIVDV